jgi:hypothetical protein
VSRRRNISNPRGRAVRKHPVLPGPRDGSVNASLKQQPSALGGGNCLMSTESRLLVCSHPLLAPVLAPSIAPRRGRHVLGDCLTVSSLSPNPTATIFAPERLWKLKSRGERRCGCTNSGGPGYGLDPNQWRGGSSLMGKLTSKRLRNTAPLG